MIARTFSFFKSNRTMITPSPISSCCSNRLANPIKSRPLRYSFLGSINLQKNIFPCVISLLNRCSPITIIRRIFFIVITAFYAVLRAWPSPHVFNKSRKVVNPFIANSDSSFRVILSCYMLWVMASSFDCNPYSILRYFFTKPVLGVPTDKSFTLEAATAFSMSVPKLNNMNRDKDTTFALANKHSFNPPAIFTRDRISFDNDGQPTIFFTRIYNKFCRHKKSLISGLSLLRSVEGRVMNPAFQELPYPQDYFTMRSI